VNDPRLWRLALESLRNRLPCAVLIAVETEGSGPGRPGAAMAVTGAGGTLGTVGGGTMEMVLMGRALEMLGNGVPGPELVRHLHAEHGDPGDGSPSGMICSGSQLTAILPLGPASEEPIARMVDLLGRGLRGTVSLSPAGLALREGPPAADETGFLRTSDGWTFTWPLGFEDTVYVVGGGHVGRALAELLSKLPFRPVILDERNPPQADLPYEWRTVAWAEAASLIPPGRHSWAVVMTPGHQADGMVLRGLLSLELGYLGLMGSRAKRESLFAELREAGIPEERLSAVRCPAGLPIGGRSPWEIAVSIAAQMLSDRNGKAGSQVPRDGTRPETDYSGENWSLPTPQTGQTQSSGSSSKAVSGGMPPSGSPSSGS